MAEERRVAAWIGGNVTATQRAEVGGTGVVHGDITAPRMVVAEGASLSGRLTIGALDAGQAARPPASR